MAPGTARGAGRSQGWGGGPGGAGSGQAAPGAAPTSVAPHCPRHGQRQRGQSRRGVRVGDSARQLLWSLFGSKGNQCACWREYFPVPTKDDCFSEILGPIFFLNFRYICQGWATSPKRNYQCAIREKLFLQSSLWLKICCWDFFRRQCFARLKKLTALKYIFMVSWYREKQQKKVMISCTKC